MQVADLFMYVFRRIAEVLLHPEKNIVLDIYTSVNDAGANLIIMDYLCNGHLEGMFEHEDSVAMSIVHCASSSRQATCFPCRKDKEVHQLLRTRQP